MIANALNEIFEILLQRPRMTIYWILTAILTLILYYLIDVSPFSGTIKVIVKVGLITAYVTAFITYILIRHMSRSAQMREYELTLEKFRKLDENDFEGYERVKQIREEKLEFEFKDNIGRTFVIQQLRLKGVAFFEDCTWEFRPGVNVLLGRNGYGKSLILRTIAALLQRDEEKSQDLLASPKSAIELAILRDGNEKLIRRTSERFTASVGKIPILAIPDSRFLDRSQTKIGPSGETHDNLCDDGAYHFLQQLPYAGIINSVLHEICLDYWEHGKSFKLPVFRFLEQVVSLLARDLFKFSSIERIGRETYEIKVITEGTDTPLPIQYASQGTLSILSLFGLIRSFLKSVFGESDKVNEQPAIVIIDETDAHLHPKWQQSVTELLRQFFPRIQFIICAQNPVMAAGCLELEVAVLRLSNRKFHIEQLNRDFVGATPQELYAELFDIDDPDDSLRRYPCWRPLDSEAMEQFQQLDKKAEEGELEAREYLDHERMIRGDRLRRRVSEVIDEREDENMKILKLEAEIERLNARIHKLDQISDGGDERVQK